MVVVSTRKERDSLGEKELPDDVYYGIQTQRAIENFPVSGIRVRSELIQAYVLVKKAAALANMKLGELDKEIGSAIVQAADEIMAGELADQFPLDVHQAGAGTSTNMNVNEVLANRALEILGKKRGDYQCLSPNDHVNKAQSTNDTYPTASQLAILFASKKLVQALIDLADAFYAKGDEFHDILKSGRTHLMDALPVTLGDEFRAYGTMIDRAAERIEQRREELRELPIGGTATGTGANSHPKYRETVLEELGELCEMRFLPARDAFESTQSRSLMVTFSGSMRELAIELIKIANDLRLLGSGPTTGLAEIQLPAVQPGSSIMPGKVNPVMAECLDMICFQVIGNDSAIALAAQAGQLELNVMSPLITYNALESVIMLSNFLPVFQKRCIEGITADEERCRSYIEMNPSLATFLVPKIGYLRAAQIAEEAQERKMPAVKVALEKGVITQKEADELFSMRHIIPTRRL